MEVGEGEQEEEKNQAPHAAIFQVAKVAKLEAGVAVYTSTSEQTLTRAATEKLN